ncbi:6,7-dimethyl-8-ribityllumazine synthase [Legionella beliardensis]|uniref:6,7-dimethyl-8-ribityllumazine synthase n=1 Tax=Legionella beliardensis TaxID=91822 RepID=A0A378HZ69_9GAMM|nr:6,7-dimethyl-8-ribityllumazine synthase [Legionella beliardensis]STX28052.1 6,7-dimethyl-8-ribityllumazine synthase [Legionella beliardensis]
MSEQKILVVWSNYYEQLAEKQLESCLKLLKESHYRYHVETVEAGTYEIPAVMQYYHQNKPFNGYIPLSLLLKGRTDHYEFIWEHVKECFIKFALDGLLLGNGIISAPSLDILQERVANGERVKEAFQAVDYLIRLKNRQIFSKNTSV